MDGDGKGKDGSRKVEYPLGAIAGERMSTPWHTLAPEKALELLRSTPSGLEADEAGRRLAEHGPNLLKEKPKPSALRKRRRRFICGSNSKPN